LWRLASRGFSWYLRSGFPSYDLIYGSLSAIVVLLLWIYLSNIIVLLGAHVCAAINEQRE
jgi:membrane protein